jgi:hypothetical protein
MGGEGEEGVKRSMDGDDVDNGWVVLRRFVGRKKTTDDMREFSN